MNDILFRKERASLTPIGSLAAWGGSSGGLVVKAIDETGRKRKAPPGENGTAATDSGPSSPKIADTYVDAAGKNTHKKTISDE